MLYRLKIVVLFVGLFFFPQALFSDENSATLGIVSSDVDPAGVYVAGQDHIDAVLTAELSNFILQVTAIPIGVVSLIFLPGGEITSLFGVVSALIWGGIQLGSAVAQATKAGYLFPLESAQELLRTHARALEATWSLNAFWIWIPGAGLQLITLSLLMDAIFCQRCACSEYRKVFGAAAGLGAASGVLSLLSASFGMVTYFRPEYVN